MSYPTVSVKYMFDFRAPGQFLDGITPRSTVPADPGPGPAQGPQEPPAPDLGAVPLERLEAQLCEVAGHLAAATCRFLLLLAEFDTRRGWASWEMNSCAAWLVRK